MTEESGDITQSIRLVTVYRVVIVGEGLLEALTPNTIELAETLSNETIKIGVGTFL
jgi:hypothetical protein